MKKIIHNNYASSIPFILFIVTIVVCGAMYTLFFLEVGFPALENFIPASESKTFIMMGLYAIPLIILVVGIIAMIIAGQKRGVYP